MHGPRHAIPRQATRLAILALTTTAALACGARSPLEEGDVVSDATEDGGGGATLDACPGGGPTIVGDHLRVRFLPLPTVDVTAGLTPDERDPNAQFSESSTNDFGATNPFNYSAALDGSTYDAIRGGSATYDYAPPLRGFALLWGTLDASNRVALVGDGGVSIGSLDGATLAAAATRALGSRYVFEHGVHVFVSSDAPIDALEMIGGADLPFEYANLETTALACP
ncbi:MAG TPA: hypothetical protein VGM56_11540 [Byssovorax sp.]|jgi:hypothetical protein